MLKWYKNYREDHSIEDFIGFVFSILSVIIAIFTAIFQNNTILGILFAILIIIIALQSFSYIKYKRHSVNLKDLYNERVPLISIISYFLKNRDVECKNKFYINELDVSYAFETENDNVAFSEKSLTLKRQLITYHFRGVNQMSETLFSFYLRMINSIFNNINQYSFIAKCNDVHLEHLEAERTGTMQSEIKIRIPNGVRKNESLDLEFKNIGSFVKFHCVEHFILDPKQYATNNINIHLSVSSNNIMIQNGFVTILRVNRDTFSRKVIYYGLFKEFHYSFTTKSKYLYLICIDGYSSKSAN